MGNNGNTVQVRAVLKGMGLSFWTTPLDKSSHDGLKTFVHRYPRIRCADRRSKEALFNAIASHGFLEPSLMGNLVVKPVQKTKKVIQSTNPVEKAPRPKATQVVSVAVEPCKSEKATAELTLSTSTIKPQATSCQLEAEKSVSASTPPDGNSHAAMVEKLQGKGEKAVPCASPKPLKHKVRRRHVSAKQRTVSAAATERIVASVEDDHRHIHAPQFGLWHRSAVWH